jgi:glycosyltransferase involved in cell wall biosynthesis
MSRHILIFSLAYYPRFVSGAEAAVHEITDRISSDAFVFHMITMRFDMRDPREERIGNIHIHRVGFGASYLSKICSVPLMAARARTLHRSHQIDAIWALMTYMTIPTVLARVLGVRVPYVVTLQDGDTYEKVFGRWFIAPVVPVIDYGFRHAHVFHVISNYLGAWPKKRGYHGRIEVIPNGADPRDVADSVSSGEIQELRAKLGKKENEVYLINTARLEHQKAYDVVIRALTKLPAHIKLLVVGSGTEEVSLKALADTCGVRDRVIFVGQVSRDEVTVYRKVSDIFVAPSRSEGLGNAFLSAMASEIPVIATQEGGLTEFIFGSTHNKEREQTAWVVPKDDVDAIARSVEYILAHNDEVKLVTARARKMVLERFDWDTIARDMETQVFKPLLA